MPEHMDLLGVARGSGPFGPTESATGRHAFSHRCNLPNFEIEICVPKFKNWRRTNSNEEIELLVQDFGGFIAESGCKNTPHAIRQTSIL